MRRGLFIVGIVLMIVGVLLVTAVLAVNANPTSQSIPSGQALSIQPNVIGTASVSIAWTGLPAAGTLYVITGGPTCSSPAGLVAKGSGSSGSMSVTMNGGTAYAIYACNGTSPVSVNVQYDSVGFSTIALFGVILLVIGLVLAVVGYRGKPKEPVAPA